MKMCAMLPGADAPARRRRTTAGRPSLDPDAAGSSTANSPRRVKASDAIHSRVAGWRHAGVTGEGDAEGAGRAVTYTFRHPIHAELALAQQPLGQRHAPSQEILHRRENHPATEAREENRAGQGRL